ncbi:aldehyde dehydrogenase family protein [Pseudomonas putida]|uniref:aldehyde dehydrogenase family protein n=1 Tax=Pseudomonas TaxID=286 RepID=UPI000D72DED1|nr:MULTISPECIES: aldehyde dehydrogenase family protein [Pseudomonas]MCI1023530.1 aldehyde dehydrogenase family protein [Pseudomonas putida]MDN4513679.1 aldehyde dehydrogenase family protein [Pseudomonas sp. 2,4-D]PWY44022.1 hypothetical protein DK184_04565 [Pseudomonas sp. RW405]
MPAPDNRQGGIVCKSHFKRIKSYPEYTAEQKLSIVHGAKPRRGSVQPTIVGNVDCDNPWFVEAMFGPVSVLF